jgi:predicted Zn-dependent protease
MLATTIKRAADLLATDPQAAERAARTALGVAPNDPRPALILASALRRRGDAAGALGVLEPLARTYPRAALTHYELGLARLAAGALEGAAAALGRSLDIDPKLAGAWRALGEVRFKLGDRQGAEAAFADHRLALVKDARLRPAAEAIRAGRLETAESLLLQILSGRPADVAALRLLAETLIGLMRYAEAEVILERLLTHGPSDDGVRFSYAVALFHQQKAAQALPHLERLLAAAPEDPAFGNLTAACLELVGRFDEAAALYERLLALYRAHPLLWLNYGHILRIVGRSKAAAEAYRQAAALDPGLGEAYLSLANLFEGALAASDMACIRRGAQTAGLTTKDRANLSFALGRAHEAAKDYEAAFAAYAAGAALRRREAPYDPEAFSAYVEACMSQWSQPFFVAREGYGHKALDPIFIVGLHRSGSTLIEQILASHPAVEGTMELPNLGLIARSLGWREPTARAASPGDWLLKVDAAAAAQLGARYMGETLLHRPLGRRLFTDKMPNNFQLIGLIHLILPRAKIIDVRRHPLGACLSGFKQHFADAQPFTYDLADIGRYYRDYVALMDHVDRVLPGRVHRVIYEDVVDDPEIEVRRLLTYCGLEFDEACLNFHRNDRPVRTVSSEQVRRPIYREGVELWRRYEPWLEPLKIALGPALEHWRGTRG